MNTASQLSDSIGTRLCIEQDWEEAVQAAINECLPEASDDYKANLYAYVVDGGSFHEEMIVQYMEQADG